MTTVSVFGGTGFLGTGFPATGFAAGLLVPTAVATGGVAGRAVRPSGSSIVTRSATPDSVRVRRVPG